jgi:hypothetical protein
LTTTVVSSWFVIAAIVVVADTHAAWSWADSRG